jgi:hypothetical protein
LEVQGGARKEPWMNLEVMEAANLLWILAIAIVAIWLAVQIMRGRI